MSNITAHDLAGAGHSIRINRQPDECSWCHRHVHPKYIGAYVSLRNNDAQVLYRCTAAECERIFIATHILVKGTSGLTGTLAQVEPWKPERLPFPASVAEVSPQFVAVRNQVEAAAGAGLDQLVGIGLRKALEFLIKDFAVSQNTAAADDIRSQTLSACINNYIADENVKQCAARAAWLGNDETHYVRRWESKDVEDLRVLVQLTMNWIDNVLLTRKYLEEMQKS